MSCCGQSRPTRPVTPPKSYGTRGLNPQAGTAGTPAFSQQLTSQPASSQQPTPVVPKRDQDARLILPPKENVAVEKDQIAKALNAWMHAYIEDPSSFEHEFETVRNYLAESGADKVPSYGEVGVAYMEKLLAF